MKKSKTKERKERLESIKKIIEDEENPNSESIEGGEL